MLHFKNLSNQNQVIVAIMAATIFYIALFFIFILQPVKVEAQSPKRLQLQTEERVNGWNPIQVICDTANGNLLYATSVGGIWVVPNGCQKNPSK